MANIDIAVISQETLFDYMWTDYVHRKYFQNFTSHRYFIICLDKDEITHQVCPRKFFQKQYPLKCRQLYNRICLSAIKLAKTKKLLIIAYEFSLIVYLTL